MKYISVTVCHYDINCVSSVIFGQTFFVNSQSSLRSILLCHKPHTHAPFDRKKILSTLFSYFYFDFRLSNGIHTLIMIMNIVIFHFIFISSSQCSVWLCIHRM